MARQKSQRKKNLTPIDKNSTSIRKSTSPEVTVSTDAKTEVFNKKKEGTPTTSSAASDVELIVDEKCKKSPPALIIAAGDVEAVGKKLENTPTVMATDTKTTVSIKSHPAITTVSKPVETTKDKGDGKESTAELSPILLKTLWKQCQEKN